MVTRNQSSKQSSDSFSDRSCGSEKHSEFPSNIDEHGPTRLAELNRKELKANCLDKLDSVKTTFETTPT